MKKQAGFTLIEIAIVLVIIGLLLGGVLKGQEMITNSKIKRTTNDINGISAAIYSYLDRYAAFPGDDPNANARWGAGAVSGDGNGVIAGTCYQQNVESTRLWDHLRRAGLVSGTGTNNPTHAFGARIGIENNAGGLIGATICLEDIQGKIAEIVDRQIDDGAGNTGEMRSLPADAVYGQNTNYQLYKKL